MPHRPTLKKPNFENQFVTNCKDEFFALRSFFRFHWFAVVLFACAVSVFMYLVRPFPPRVVTLATGQPDSTYDAVGQMYQAYFRRHGIELRLVPTHGAVDNNQLISDQAVDAAFSQSGVPIPQPDQVISLGSIEFEPVWFFYRGAPLNSDNLPHFLANKKVSVGAAGSGTKYMVFDLLEEYQVPLNAPEHLRVMNTEDSVTALERGQIDGMFILADMSSKQLWLLLNNPELRILNFNAAHAIASKLGYLDPIVFPRGAVSLNPVRPDKDIDLVATNTRILVDKDMHPAIQYLFMMAGANFYRNTDVYFNRAGGFPAFLDNDTEKSEVALKYLKSSTSILERTFPFWIASFLDRAWLMVAALFALAYPLLKMVPRYRSFHFNAAMNDCYIAMRQIEALLSQCASRDDFQLIQLRFDYLEQQVRDMWVPINSNERYYLMLNAAWVLKEKIDRARHDWIDSVQSDSYDPTS